MSFFWRSKKVILFVALFVFLTSSFPALGMAKGNQKPLSIDSGKSDSEKSIEERFLPKKGLNTWVPSGDFATSSLIKVPRFPDEIMGDVNDRNLQLSAVRNEQVSAQLAVASTNEIKNLNTFVSDIKNENGDTISSEDVQIRYVGYVQVEEKSEKVGGSLVSDVAGRAVSGDKGLGVVADPLLEVSEMDVPDHQAQPIWFTFDIPKSVEPGNYKGEITLTSENNKPITYDLQLTIHDVEMPDPENYKFHLDIWMNPNAIADEYNVPPWSKAHWELIKKYFVDLADSGQSAITTTIIQNPWLVSWNDWKPQTAVGYDSMVKWKYDGENWDFDYSIFDRYVQTGLEAGLGPNINAYSMLTFRGPQRITYLDEQTSKTVTEWTEVGSQIWTEAWTAFLNDFSDHLEQKGWMDQTYIAFDERPAHLMSQALDLIRNNAPEFLNRTQVAGTSDVNPYAQLLSLGINSLTQVSDEWVKERHESGKETTYYVWAGDHHPNTLSFSPAVESRMMPWIAADRNLEGFLRWAYNNWPEDIFHNPVYAFSQGDEYFIYPGEEGPMSSIRWELLKEGIEDYELFQMAKAGNQDSKVVEEASDLATRQWDGREKKVLDVVLAREMIIGQLVTRNADEMEEIAGQFQKVGGFENDQAAHKVKIHLTAVSHFENKGEAEKVIKHLQGFKQLLHDQHDNGLISGMAYHTLKENADSLIGKWDQ